MILLCLNLKNNQNFLSITCTQNIKNIKFTIETEDLNNVSFFRCQNYTQKQLLRIFTKLHLVEFLLLTSFIFNTYEAGLVHTLLFQFFKFCSSMENVHIEIEHLRNIFKCNNYPVNILDQCIKKFLDKLYVPKHTVPTVPKREFLVVLPYLGKFSLNLRMCLHKSVSKSLPQCNIKSYFSVKISIEYLA